MENVLFIYLGGWPIIAFLLMLARRYYLEIDKDDVPNNLWLEVYNIGFESDFVGVVLIVALWPPILFYWMFYNLASLIVRPISESHKRRK